MSGHGSSPANMWEVKTALQVVADGWSPITFGSPLLFEGGVIVHQDTNIKLGTDVVFDAISAAK